MFAVTKLEIFSNFSHFHIFEFMGLLQIILLPVTFIYRYVTGFRNWLYDNGYKKSFSFPLPVISVGNLTVGGTGKTPHVEYLIRLLNDHLPLATLSRGYGRQTKGFIVAGTKSSAGTIGDEPMQFYRKFGNQIQVTVGEKRVLAIQQIIRLYPQTKAIVLDDAFQHRAVRPSFSVLLSDYNRPFYSDYVLPSGRLRESRKGAKRADIIIVSKCPHHIQETERAAIVTQIRKYSHSHTPIYFTGIQYGKPIPYHTHTLFAPRILLVSGLANPLPLEEYVRVNYQLLHHLVFKDHHTYTRQDVLRMQTSLTAYQADIILTTEKDYVKLIGPALEDLVSALPFYYLPIEVCFLFGQQEAFDKNLWTALNHKKTNY
jgi:tetraacyldisaccharide 4'-kinase